MMSRDYNCPILMIFFFSRLDARVSEPLTNKDKLYGRASSSMKECVYFLCIYIDTILEISI